MVKLLLALLIPFVAFGAEARLTLPDPAVPGVVLQGEVTVTDPPSGVARVELPAVEGLEWEIGRTGTQTQIVNGARSTTVQIGLHLRASRTGTYGIPPITLHLRDGSQVRTAAASLRVDAGDTRLTGELVAEAAFEPATIVPGETTTLTYRLWVRRGEVQTLGIQPPEGAISLGERSLVQGRTYDAQGQPWTTVTVTWPLTFAAPGSHTVRGQQEVLIPVGDGFFDQRVARRQTAVAPTTLTVSPLPDAGRPADFTGLIGPVTAAATLARERVSVGEGVILEFAVSGRQVDLVRRPPLTLPGVQIYPKDEVSEAGRHVFRWDLVPTAPGSLTIPPLAVAYFDPQGRTYRQAASLPLTLTILPGRSRDLGAVGAVPATTEEPPSSAAAAPPLPAPRRGAAAAPVPGWWGPTAGGAALAIGAGLGWWLGRPRRAPHRGRALRAAGQDPAALAVALERLRPALTTPAHQAAAARLQAAIDGARFGNQPLGDLADDLRVLEDLP